MTESTIADFVADFIPDSEVRSEPVRGRVVMSRRRIVLARSEGRTTIPLSSVFDVGVGQVPPEVSDFFDDTVTIAYGEEDRRTAIIEGDGETMDRFTTVLFKAILAGTTASVTHPARIAGRVTDEPARRAKLRLRNDEVEFVGNDDSFAIDLSTVVYFDREEREIDGTTRPALSVRHTSGGQPVTSEIALPSGREMNLLGRYLRLEYGELIQEVRELTLPESETEVLVGLYTAGEGADLASMLGKSASSVTMLVNTLEEKGLVEQGPDGTALTAKGRMAVSDRIEHVNM